MSATPVVGIPTGVYGAPARRRREDTLHVVRPEGRREAPERRTHLFVHTVRFWSMAAIIAMHSMPPVHIVDGLSPTVMQLCIQPFKFGTIGFFLISGFLMGERLVDCKPWDYLRRRLATIFAPWLFWLVLLSAYLLTTDILHHRIVVSNPSTIVAAAWHALEFCFRHTPFWFVPNLFIGMGCLLLFRRRLHDVRLGAALLVVNLFYVVNIYTRWIPSAHTDATLGFAFYLWMGAYAARHLETLQRWVAAVPMTLLVLGAVAVCGLGVMESRLLQVLHAQDPMNTLRLSNQIFSVVMVLLLLRVERRSWPGFVDVANNTFGLYLTHPLMLVVALSTLHHTVRQHVGPAMVFLIWAEIFLFAYGASLMLTKVIARTSGMEFLVGAKGAAVLEKRSAVITRLAIRAVN